MRHDRLQAQVTGQDVRIIARQNDGISGIDQNRFCAWHCHKCTAFDNQVIGDQLAWQHIIRNAVFHCHGREDGPWCREVVVEEHRSAQPDHAQDLGQRIV